LVAAATAVGLLIGIGGAGFYWNDGSGLDKAKSLIDEGNFREAVAILRPLQQTTRFHRRESDYLLAVAALRQYAAVPNARNLPPDFAVKPVDGLAVVLQAGPKWRDQAKADHLPELITFIPAVPDEFERGAFLADTLQKLELADDRVLAKQLLSRLKARIDANRDLDGIHAVAINKVLRLDPTIADDLLAVLLPDACTPQRMAIARRLAGEDPALAKTWSKALSERALRLWMAGKQAPGNALLSAAEAICPERREACARQLLAWLKGRSADKDYRGVARGLQGVNLDDIPPALRAELVGICLQAARGLAKVDPPAAQQALDKAFQLAPAEAAGEANALLWIDLHPEQSDQKIVHCKDFLDTFPKADRADDVRKALWAIALQWAEKGRRDEAVDLGKWLLNNTPESLLRKQIDEKVTAWQGGHAANPAPAAAESPEAAKQAELDAKLAEHKQTVTNLLALINAMQDKDVWIIEVADGFDAGKFTSPGQMKLFQEWVSSGGIVWANNSVLGLLGIHYSTLWEGKGLECAATGKHPICEGVKTVRLNDIAHAAHSLTGDQAIPLLTLKKPAGAGRGQAASGTVIWSLVPYGSGWISNPKPVDLKQDDGARFWSRFCQFCLRETLVAGNAPPAPEKPNPAPAPAAKGRLSGVWKGTTTAAHYRLTDDGKNASVELSASEAIKSISGTLARETGVADAKTLTGDLVVVFYDDLAQPFTVKATLTILRDGDLEVSFENWPVWANNGKLKGTRTQKDIWSRNQ
jgi:hypothetical protein